MVCLRIERPEAFELINYKTFGGEGVYFSPFSFLKIYPGVHIYALRNRLGQGKETCYFV